MCSILGIPLKSTEDGRTDNTPSVDRIDNAKGYSSDNTVICSWRANLLKDASIAELIQLTEFYKGYLHG